MGISIREQRQKPARLITKRFFFALKLYLDLSNEDVIVQEFISGFWLSELLRAVEHNDQKAMATLRMQNIDPKVVAKRLLWICYWGLWETLFFHADPHPANIIIQPNNKIVFIDFGSGGSFSRSRRLALHALNDLLQKDDVEGVARVSLTFMEPLPPIDVDAVLKEIEAEYHNALAGMRAKSSRWWEKTTAQIWLGFFKVSSRHKIPLALGTVRMIRATLLYDTLSLRLNHSIDLEDEYVKYRRGVGKQTKKRVHKRIRRIMDRGFDKMDYLRFEETMDLGTRLLYRAQRLFDTLSFKSVSTLSKPIVVLFEAFKLVINGIILLGFLVMIIAGAQYLLFDAQISFADIVKQLVLNVWIHLFILVLVGVYIRRVYFRLKDRD